jgi:hypothetical protein
VAINPIRDTKGYESGSIDFTTFNGCFKKNVGMSDIDGVTERKGHFLFLEKKYPGAKVPEGQTILLESLSRYPQNTVVVFWGDESKPERVELWIRSRHIPVDSLNALLSCWYECVDKHEPFDIPFYVTHIVGGDAKVKKYMKER